MLRDISPFWRRLALPLALSFLPLAAGVYRLTTIALGSAPEGDTGSARAFDAPLPIVIHIVAATVLCIVGAWQLTPPVGASQRQRHRLRGRIVALAGLTVATGALWMSWFYPVGENHSALLTVFRTVFSVALGTSLLLGVAAARQRRIADHGAWMSRAYAIALGTGVQTLLGVGWMSLFGQPDPRTWALLAGAGWVIPLAIVQWQLSTGPRRIAPRHWSFAT